MSSSVSITGIGLVTPLGENARATWDSLLAGRFITDHTAIAHANIFQMARAAASEAIADAGWVHRAAALSGRTALIVGTSKGPIKSWIDGSGIEQGLSAVADALMPLGFFERNMTLSAACASGLHALIRGVLMLQSGECDRVLVVAAEASVHPLFIGSFQRLGVLARPEIGCRPFDERREGFLMSEAAAAICLERGTAGYAEIDRFALGGDASHLISSDPKAKTLRRLLRHVLADQSCDLFHAHGTGTVVNDAIELTAIESTLRTPSPGNPGEGGGEGEFAVRVTLDVRNRPHPNPLPDYRERGPEVRSLLYSHKGALGHSLGAAGLIAVVINALAHRHEIIPPNARTSQPMPMNLLLPIEPTRRLINCSVAIASGFGGGGGSGGINESELTRGEHARGSTELAEVRLHEEAQDMPSQRSYSIASNSRSRRGAVTRSDRASSLAFGEVTRRATTNCSAPQLAAEVAPYLLDELNESLLLTPTESDLNDSEATFTGCRDSRSSRKVAG